MHSRRALLFIHIFLVLFISSVAFSETEAERRSLQSELSLAQTKHIYFILNLKEKKIYFKARGLVLRALDIQKVRLWGRPEAVKLYALTAKASSDEPQREQVIPENVKKDEKAPAPVSAVPEVKALELEDMPSSFKLVLDDGLIVSVRPDNKGMLQGLYAAANSLYWHVSQPMLTVWYAIKGKPYGTLNLVLNEKDARALYWSMYEGAGVLIYNPQDH